MANPSSSLFADDYPEDYYHLPHIMMHELGHIAGLGHAQERGVMGGPVAGDPLINPTNYDLDGLKHTYP